MPASGRTKAPSIQVGDLYLFDRNRHAATVPYPFWLVALLTFVGILAFAVLGFLGYPTDDGTLRTLFHPAWLLFLWFCSMVLIFQWSIFRHNALRLWRWQTLTVTSVCIVAVAVAYAKPDGLSALLTQLATLLNTWGLSVEGGRLLWNIANFGIITLYVVDRLSIWLRGERAQYVSIFMELEAKVIHQSDPGSSGTTMWEFVSQDLFAGAALCLALGALFQATVFNLLIRPITSKEVTSCAVSWANGTCVDGAPHNPPTLTTIDWSLALFAAAASVLLLGTILLARAFFQREREGAVTVARGVQETLLAALNPLDIFVRNLRNVLWPSFILIGIIGAGTAARYARLYLHLLSDKQTCGMQGACVDLGELSAYLGNSLDAQHFQQQALGLEALCLAIALAGGIGGTLAIVASARVQVSRWRINGPLMTNWLRFLLSVAHTVLLAFWIISLGLSALMWAFQHVGVTLRAPFPQPGISTGVSFAYFLASLVYRLVRRRPEPSVPAPQT
jgi:hypothetical protein